MAEHDLTAALRIAGQIRPALDRGDRATLAHVLGELVAMRAPMAGQWPQLAQLAAKIGEIDLARRAIDLYIEASRGDPAAQYQKAAVLADAGLWQEAHDLLCTLAPDVPSAIGHAYSRGIAALNLGKLDEAREYLARVVRERPETGPAWLALGMAGALAAEPELADRLVDAGREIDRAPPGDRAAYHYALGEVHAKRGEHAAAFAAFARGAAEMRTIAPFDRAADARQAAEAVEGYSEERIATLGSGQGAPTGRPIFVTGLPRSGTTLVEQILTSHSAVGGGAEFGGLSLLAMDVGGRSWSALAHYVETAGAAPAAALWRHWVEQRFAAPGRMVDKSVDTSRFLGLAATLLPDAPLIWLTRDPLDRAWSCFRTNFLGGAVRWSYDLEDIAAHFRLEDELLAQWRAILGERLLVVPYEELVSDPASWTRRLLAHCGLPEEPQVFAPHETARPVATASMAQVRRPISRAAIGSAAPYRAFLEPFLAAYRG